MSSQKHIESQIVFHLAGSTYSYWVCLGSPGRRSRRQGYNHLVYDILIVFSWIIPFQLTITCWWRSHRYIGIRLRLARFSRMNTSQDCLTPLGAGSTCHLGWTPIAICQFTSPICCYVTLVGQELHSAQ
jgi:hypothetical protein